jgi:hypothetical protein
VRAAFDALRLVPCRSRQAEQAALLDLRDGGGPDRVLLVGLVLLEIPLVAFTFAAEHTAVAIDRAKAWAGAPRRTIAIWGFAVIAAGLAIDGIAESL